MRLTRSGHAAVLAVLLAHLAADADWIARPTIDGADGSQLAHGTWVYLHDNHAKREATYSWGDRHGSMTSKDRLGTPRVASTWNRDRVTGVRLVNAERLRQAVAQPGFAAIRGAFGIEFGTDLAQFEEARCEQRIVRYPTAVPGSCVGIVASNLHGSIATESGTTRSLTVIPPNPLSRRYAHRYYFSYRAGIVGAEARVDFGSADHCRREAATLNRLLKQKYGDCAGRQGYDCDGRRAYAMCSREAYEASGERVDVPGGRTLVVSYDMDLDSVLVSEVRTENL